MLRKIKLIIKLFIPPFFYFTKEILRGIKGKLLLIGKKTINNQSNNESRLLILGNGPSLNNTLEKVRNFNTFDILTVNLFAKTDYYKIIKPRWYLLADPAFFLRSEELSVRHKTVVDELKDCIINKTEWKLNLCIPVIGYNSDFIKEIITKNSNIEIYCYNNLGDESIFTDESLKFYLWNHSLLCLKQQTVLNSAIHIGIVQGYKEIYITGADSSWHENLFLDQETNILYTKDTHFYGSENKVPIYADANCKIRSKVHEELYYISKALSNYWTLSKYAEYNKCKIYNISSYSWIDAFERYKF